ncbi:hypothetical protein EI94DRAFT_1699437 [Lactarius quietus]|nr:hypothetical protein EI94DRAFT_1699437 [Lactarius quietus]
MPSEGTYWGKFNNQPLSKLMISELVAGFHKMVNNSTDQTVLDVVMKKNCLMDLKSFQQLVKGMSINQVMELRLSEAGVAETKNDNIWMLRGHHRHQALQIYAKEKERMIAEVKKKLAALSHGKDDEDTEGKREELEDKIVKEKGKIAAGKKWAVRVYNQEAIEANPPDLTNAIIRFISRNEVKYWKQIDTAEMLRHSRDVQPTWLKDPEDAEGVEGWCDIRVLSIKYA